MVSSNVFQNVASISGAALDVLHNNLRLATRVNRQYDKAWQNTGTKIGDTYSVRLPGFASYRTGSVAQPTAYNDSYVQLTLAQGGADFLFTEKELTLNIDEFRDNVLAPQMAVVMNAIDLAGQALVPGVSQFSGTLGTAPTSLLPFLNAKSIMDKQSACPFDGNIFGMVDTDVQAAFISGMAGTFNPQAAISEQYRAGFMGDVAGIEWFSTVNAPAFTTGTWAAATPTYTSGGTDGSATIVTGGWGASGTINAGDVFEIAGVYAVNPVGKSLTSQLKQFVVTSPATVAGNAATLNFSPALHLTGPLQNVNALPSGSASIKMWPTDTKGTGPLGTGVGAISPQSLVFHKDAFLLGLGDMEMIAKENGAQCSRARDPQTNLNVRVTKFYDGYQDKTLFRLDVLFGWAYGRPGFAARVVA